MSQITYERAHELLSYNPDNGKLFWKVDHCGKKAGTEAGYVRGKGTSYREIEIDGKRYAAQRLIWFMQFYEWPYGRILHKDGNRLNNRINNLKDDWRHPIRPSWKLLELYVR